MLKKVEKRYIIVGVVCALIIISIINCICINIAKKKNLMEATENVSSNMVQSSVVSSAQGDVASKMENTANTDIESDSDDVIKPIDCNPDFWAVKYGIAECYDHILKKNHMQGNIYYQGDCEEHEPTEINELARKVKLYRDDGGIYTAVLPEIGWTISIYDEKIQSIIDAQIEGNGGVYFADDVSIVMFFSDGDNTLSIEFVNEE